MLAKRSTYPYRLDLGRMLAFARRSCRGGGHGVEAQRWGFANYAKARLITKLLGDCREKSVRTQPEDSTTPARIVLSEKAHACGIRMGLE